MENRGVGKGSVKSSRKQCLRCRKVQVTFYIFEPLCKGTRDLCRSAVGARALTQRKVATGVYVKGKIGPAEELDFCAVRWISACQDFRRGAIKIDSVLRRREGGCKGFWRFGMRIYLAGKIVVVENDSSGLVYWIWLCANLGRKLLLYMKIGI